jgi:class 3 adenylate cyclase
MRANAWEIDMSSDSQNDQQRSRKVGFRIDFVLEVVSIDEKTHTVCWYAKPDPRRYEWRIVDGKRHLYDKFDHLLFPEDVLAKFAKGLKGQPLYYEPQKMRDAAEYVRSRRPMILSYLEGKQPPPTFADPSDDFLRSLEADKLEFVILSLDLVGSTKLVTNLPLKDYSRIIQTVLFEIAEIIPLFHGHVLKYTGDGIIAYFPAPSFITKNDLAFDCALTLRRLLHDGLNPILAETGYEPLDLRIGLDSGEAAVVVVGSPATKQHIDIIGAVISMACKIHSRAPAGGIALGDATLRNLHTGWREICNEMPMGADWKYMDPETGKPYRVHKVEFC